ncbi:MAG: mechanosensitive ion channel, partial [Flavobacteriales bacterium]|nr:mechanosensitive ion channel [Flavobacteriales bacterium]
MGEFLDFSFYDSELIQITVGNILLLILIIVVTRILLQVYKKAVHKGLRARDNFDQEREHIVQRTGKAIIVILGIFSAIVSIGLWRLIQVILDFDLIKFEKTNITVGKIFIFVLILAATGVVARLIRVILRKNFSQKTWIDEAKEYTVYKLTKYGLFTAAVIIGLTSIGIDMKLILAGAGALLVGIGFGLQYLFYD